MQRNIVLNSKRNEVYEQAKARGLNPSEFVWEERASKFINHTMVSVLTHRPTGFYYIFDIKGGLHWAEYSPGPEYAIEQILIGSWESQFRYVVKWLDYLKIEIESPDIWGAISQESELLDATVSDDDNSPFTKNEKEDIFTGLKEIKQYLIDAHQINAELVESRLKYLEEATDRLGRKDWINILFSIIIGIILNATVSPESAREIFRFISVVFGEFIKHPQLLL